ncbi:hypothetical protein ACVBEH_04165 [Roseateles sp. GG27B]
MRSGRAVIVLHAGQHAQPLWREHLRCCLTAYWRTPIRMKMLTMQPNLVEQVCDAMRCGATARCCDAVG